MYTIYVTFVILIKSSNRLLCVCIEISSIVMQPLLLFLDRIKIGHYHYMYNVRANKAFEFVYLITMYLLQLFFVVFIVIYCYLWLLVFFTNTFMCSPHSTLKQLYNILQQLNVVWKGFYEEASMYYSI